MTNSSQSLKNRLQILICKVLAMMLWCSRRWNFRWLPRWRQCQSKAYRCSYWFPVSKKPTKQEANGTCNSKIGCCWNKTRWQWYSEQIACATRGGGRSEAGHCFHLLFFLFFFFLRLLLFTHFGESPVRENLFPPIFWHNYKIYAKKIFVKVIFYLFTKKNWFSRVFSERPVFGHRAWTNP